MMGVITKRQELCVENSTNSLEKADNDFYLKVEEDSLLGSTVAPPLTIDARSLASTLEHFFEEQEREDTSRTILFLGEKEAILNHYANQFAKALRKGMTILAKKISKDLVRELGMPIGIEEEVYSLCVETLKPNSDLAYMRQLERTNYEL
ncbi:MAG: hypothetical protein ACE5I5_06560 [Candidatus Heimdallarchaeota archaeon]